MQKQIFSFSFLQSGRPSQARNVKRTSILAWLWLTIGLLYLGIPLAATFIFSVSSQLRAGIPISFSAYINVITDPNFSTNLWFSVAAGLLTIVISTALLVPMAYWVQLRMPFLRSTIELMTLLPIVVPVIVQVFGLIALYNRTWFTNDSTGLFVLMVGAYVVLAFPYTYRPINAAFQAINVKVLTEAAQSLGAGWGTILLRVILPNVWGGVLNAAFITFAIALGEFTISSLLAQQTFSMYLYGIKDKIYEPVAFTVISFLLTWFFIAVLQQITKRPSQRKYAPGVTTTVRPSMGLPTALQTDSISVVNNE
jgi:putative spermidine/putrescine transport system permease protein